MRNNQRSSIKEHLKSGLRLTNRFLLADPKEQVMAALSLENRLEVLLMIAHEVFCNSDRGYLCCVVSLRPWQERGSGRRRAKGERLWSDAKW